ncbi:hypothetical protein B9Z19DRAFT_1011341, partial [Tuber borchii]
IFLSIWNLVDKKSWFVSFSWDRNVKLICFLLPFVYEELANFLNVDINYLLLTLHDLNLQLHSQRVYLPTLPNSDVYCILRPKRPLRHPHLTLLRHVSIHLSLMHSPHSSLSTGITTAQTSLPLPEWTR